MWRKFFQKTRPERSRRKWLLVFFLVLFFGLPVAVEKNSSSLSLQTKVASAQTTPCTIGAASFNPQSASLNPPDKVWYDHENSNGLFNYSQSVDLKVDVTGCAGGDVIITIFEGTDSVFTRTILGSLLNDPTIIGFTLTLQAGEKFCNGLTNPDCTIKVNIAGSNNVQPPNALLGYDCQGLTCDNDRPWLFGNLAKINAQQEEETIDSDPAVIAQLQEKLTQPECGVTQLSGCFAYIFYLIYVVVALLAEIGANILDFFMGYSLDDKSYRADFIVEGWKVTRDIANIVFIFVLLYAALRTIIEGGSTEIQKLIKNVIVVALLINFSLFMVRAIVDATNILARIFYNNIEVKGAVPVASAPDVKPISIALVKKFDPQAILAGDLKFDINENIGKYILLCLLATYMAWTMFTVFISVGLIFLERVIMIWMLAIFAPFAFLSLALPKKTQTAMKDWGWDKWFGSLICWATRAPVFIFFLYLIILFGNVGDLISAPAGATEAQQTMAIIIPFFIVIALIKKSKEIAMECGGQLVQAFAGLVKGVAAVAAITPIGRIAGAVSGGAAAVGQRVLGGGGASLAERYKNKEGLFARSMVATGKFAAKQTYDVRGLADTGVGRMAGKGLGTVLKQAGVGLEQLPGALMAGSEKGVFGRGAYQKGGYYGDVERKGKAKDKKIKTAKDNAKTTMSNEEVKVWSKKQGTDYDTKKETFVTKNKDRLTVDYDKKFIDGQIAAGLSRSSAEGKLSMHKATAGGKYYNENINNNIKEAFEKKEGKKPQEFQSRNEYNAHFERKAALRVATSMSDGQVREKSRKKTAQYEGEYQEKRGKAYNTEAGIKFQEYMVEEAAAETIKTGKPVTAIDLQQKGDPKHKIEYFKRHDFTDKKFDEKDKDAYNTEAGVKFQEYMVKEAAAETRKTRTYVSVEDLAQKGDPKHKIENFKKDNFTDKVFEEQGGKTGTTFREKYEEKKEPPKKYANNEDWIKDAKKKSMVADWMGLSAGDTAHNKAIEGLQKEMVAIDKLTTKYDSLQKSMASVVLDKPIADVSEKEISDTMAMEPDKLKGQYEEKMNNVKTKFRTKQLAEKRAAKDYGDDNLSETEYEAVYQEFLKAEDEYKKTENLWDKKEALEVKMKAAGLMGSKTEEKE